MKPQRRIYKPHKLCSSTNGWFELWFELPLLHLSNRYCQCRLSVCSCYLARHRLSNRPDIVGTVPITTMVQAYYVRVTLIIAPLALAPRLALHLHTLSLHRHAHCSSIIAAIVQHVYSSTPIAGHSLSRLRYKRDSGHKPSIRLLYTRLINLISTLYFFYKVDINLTIQFTYKFFTRCLQPINWQMYRTIIKILSIHDHGTSWLHHSVSFSM